MRCLFIVLFLVPTLAGVVPTPSPLHWFVLATVAAGDFYSIQNCFTSWCLPPATMYKCKIVSFSCILLSLFYYYFIILFSIIFSFVFCFLSLTRLLYAPCSSWLCYVFTQAILCPCLYSVLLYKLCLLLKGFLKIEKQKE